MLWCRNILKNLNCLKLEKVDFINLFVIGGVGVGKSYLIKVIYYIVVKIFRYGIVNLDRLIVVLMVLIGVVVINIDGIIIYIVLLIFKEFGDFVFLMVD